MSKKVLLISVTAGQGHKAAAEAIREAVAARGGECEVCDLMTLMGRAPYVLVDKGYAALTKHVPRTYGFVFEHMSRRTADGSVTIDDLAMRKMFARALRGELERCEPDAVVATHIFGSMAIDELVRKHRSVPKAYGLVTDYDFHPYWEAVPNAGGIITGAKQMELRAARRGIDHERLLPLGIPVEERFERDIDRAEARRRTGVPEDAYTALMMSGSMGFEDFTEQAVQLAKSGVFTLCVCGRNTSMRAELEAAKEREELRNMRVYGFINDGELLMAAADCIITKPGGLTTTEAMTRRLPLLLWGGIPGQEIRNAEFLGAVGAAIVCKRDLPPVEAVGILRSEPWRADMLREAAARIVTPGAAGRIAEEVLR